MNIITIRIRVAECLSHTKSEFYAALRRSLDASRMIANRAATECLRQDDLTQDKLTVSESVSRNGKLYTYPVCKDLVENASSFVSTICRDVERSYRQDRSKIRKGQSCLRNYRSFPWPMLNNKSVSTFTIEDKGEFLTARIKLLDGYYTVRLAGGSNYRDSVRGLRRAIETGSIRDSEIGLNAKHVATLRLSVLMPEPEKKTRSGVVQVYSGIDCLLAMSVPRSNVPFVFNADDAKEWKAESTRVYQQKRQAIKQGADKKRIHKRLKGLSRKMKNRFDAKCHAISSQVVKKANRHNAEKIELDLTIKSFIPSFPWHDLEKNIRYKASLAGIEVVEKTQSVEDPDCEMPHVYFAYDANSHRVKIGRTQGGKGRMKSFWTTNPDWVLLAVDNRPQNQLVAREKHFHAMFDSHRVVGRNEIGNELFNADPVIEWLRAVQWLGNAGNLSQIAQVLDVADVTSRVGHLQADSVCSIA